MKKIVCLLFLLFLTIQAFAHEPENERAKPSKGPEKQLTHLDVSLELQRSLGIKTEKAELGILAEAFELPGTVLPLPKNAHEIHSPVTGQVTTDVHIPAVGERVKKGETLAVIRQTLTAPEALQIDLQNVQAQTVLAQSRNNLSLKQKAYSRAKQLYDIQAIALKDLQIAETDYENALLEFQADKRQLRFYEKKKTYLDFPLAAPIAGFITSMDITSGETVDPQKVLFKVENLSKVWIEIHVYENDIQKIHVGEKAEINASAIPGKIFYGRIQIVGMKIDPQSRTLPAMIELENPGYRLKEGMLTQVHFFSPAASRASYLTISTSSLVMESGHTFVFVKEEKTDFHRHSVIVQKTSAGKAFILKGIDPGDEVVSQGAYLLNQEWHNRETGENQGEEEH